MSLRLSISVSRPDPNQAQWRIVFDNAELAALPSARVSASPPVPGRRAPYIQIEPREADNWDALAVAESAVRVAAKQVRPGDAVRFGKHLFQVLIGDSSLPTIQALGGIEAIILNCDDKDFSRLPWELLWFDGAFAAQRGIAFVRGIGTTNSLGVRTLIEPVVLFVVGSDLHDPRIRAGAEYLGLLRRLEATGLTMVSHVITRATTKQLEDAVGIFKPSIVHIICHGGPPGADTLEFVSETPGKAYEQVSADRIAAILGSVPKVVVLNACNTGISIDATPLAANLARNGPPVVIGMAGRVADIACRLFTRGLYEALMKGDSIEAATALARREALKHGADPERTVDWAMLTLFVRDGTHLSMDTAIRQLHSKRAIRAREYRSIGDPGLICGRGECLDANEGLLGSAIEQNPRVVALQVVERHTNVSNPQYGKTRALEELASRAAMRGHLPCLVTFPQGASPKTPFELALQILDAVEARRARHRLSESPMPQLLLLKRLEYAPRDLSILSDQVRRKLDFHPWKDGATQPPSQVVGIALKEDLQSFAAAVRAHPDFELHSQVLILVDELHTCGEGGRALVQLWLQDQGLGQLATCDGDWTQGLGPIPVAIAYSAVASDLYLADIQALKSHMEQRPMLFKVCDLKAFSDPQQDDLPYQQYLLSRKPMLMLNAELSSADRAKFLGTLHSYVRGVPSRLTKDPSNEGVHAVIDVGIDTGRLLPADDDTLLARLPGVTT